VLSRQQSSNMEDTDELELIFFDAPEFIPPSTVRAAIAEILQPGAVEVTATSQRQNVESNLQNYRTPAAGVAIGNVGDLLPVTVTQAAGVSSAIAALSISKAGVSGRLVQPFKWGLFYGKPACLMKAHFEFSSLRSCRLGEAHVEVSFTSADLSADSEPRVRAREPTELRSPEPDKKQVNRGSKLAPKFNAGTFGGGEIGETHNDYAFSQVEGWSVTSNIGKAVYGPFEGAVDGKVWWDLCANVLQKQGVKHHLSVVMIVEHGGNPFSALFKLSGVQASSSWFGRLKGKMRDEVTALKEFDPTGKDCTTELAHIDLKDLVKENLQPTPGRPLQSPVHLLRSNIRKVSSDWSLPQHR
jgi:hypothetical protein